MSSISSQIDRDSNRITSSQTGLIVVRSALQEAERFRGTLAPKAVVETPEGTIEFSFNGERFAILGVKKIS